MNIYFIFTAITLVFSPLSYGSDQEKKVQGLRNYFEQLNKGQEDKGSASAPENKSQKAVGNMIERFGGAGHYVAPKGLGKNKQEASPPILTVDQGKEKKKEDKSENELDRREVSDPYTQDMLLNTDDHFLPPPLSIETPDSLENSLGMSSSTHQEFVRDQSMERIRHLGPKEVKQKDKSVKIDKLVKLKGVKDREVHKLQSDQARQKGVYPVAHVSTMDYFDFLKVAKLHKMGLKGSMIKVGVVDSWFDYEAKNLKNVITESTHSLAPIEGTAGYVANEMKFNVGFSGEKGEYQVTGHHGNHVTSIIHSIVPDSPLKYINFQAEQGIAGKEFIHYCQAIDRAIQSGVDFINFSLVFPGDVVEEPMDDTIRLKLIEAANQGIGLIVALGNDEKSSLESNYVKDLIALSQSRAMQGRMILVGATQYSDHKERRADFSNYPGEVKHGRKVIFAPGTDIRAFGGGGYKVVKSGTSQATPIVTGIAAIIKQFLVKKELESLYGVQKRYLPDQIEIAKKSITPDKVFSILLRSSRDKTFTGSMVLGKDFGRGILNPMGAVLYAEKQFEREKHAAAPLRPWAQKYKRRQMIKEEIEKEKPLETKENLKDYLFGQEEPSKHHGLDQTPMDDLVKSRKTLPVRKADPTLHAGEKEGRILRKRGRFTFSNPLNLPSPGPVNSEEEGEDMKQGKS